jgi:cyclic beta-1,2-glucan synthetase
MDLRARMLVLRADGLTGPELNTLHSLARVVIHADGRPLTHHVQDWLDLHELALQRRQGISGTALAHRAGPGLPLTSNGEFVAGQGEFVFDVHAGRRPPRPWINVLANAAFGAQISEAGGGYTWATNSRLNQLTAWSNDPVADPPSEWFLLQNSRTRELWSLAPSAGVAPTRTYRITHGQGYTSLAHQQGALAVTATWCVDAATAVKQIQVRLVNHGNRSLRLRLIGMVEWQMGANRTDRNTVRTTRWQSVDTHALLCTQRERSAGFGNGTAFFVDAMVNRWLLYQAVSCRLWAKAGFYQAGGATGFRDQLQDAMALAWTAPQMLRSQILDCAARQF